MITNKDLRTIHTGLAQSQNFDTNFRFSVWCGRMLRLIEEEFLLWEASNKPSDEYVEYLKKRKEVQERYYVKGDDGKFIISHYTSESQPVYQVDEKNPTYIEVIDQLDNMYEKALQEQKEKKKSFDAFLEKETLLRLIKIPQEELPEKIKGTTVGLLSQVILFEDDLFGANKKEKEGEKTNDN